MHVLVITFQLNGLSPADYAAGCDQAAPSIAQSPGLISKTWLANETTNTYGGVYFWRSREAIDQFLDSDAVRQVETSPMFSGFRTQVFDILEAPSRVTGGLMAAAV